MPTGSIKDVHFELIACWIQPSMCFRMIDTGMDIAESPDSWEAVDSP